MVAKEPAGFVHKAILHPSLTRQLNPLLAKEKKKREKDLDKSLDLGNIDNSAPVKKKKR